MKTRIGAWVLAIALGTTSWATVARGDPVLSAREFCAAAGGAVRETDDRAVHLCCYAERGRCVTVDERQRTTAVVNATETARTLAGHGSGAK